MPVATANGKKFNFPEGTTPEQMAEAIDEYFAGQQSEITPPASAETQPASEIAPAAQRQEVPRGINRFAPQQPIVTGGQQMSALDQQREDFLASLTPERRAQLESIGGLQALGIAAGKGVTDVARGVGLMPQATEDEKRYFEELKQVKPTSAFLGESTGQAAPFLVPGLGVASIPSGAAKVAATAGLGALEGGIVSRGQGGSAEDQLISAAVGGTLAGGLALATLKKTAESLIKKTAPSVEDLKQTASNIYKTLDESGVTVKSDSFDSLVDDVARTLKKEGLDQDLTPKSMAVLNRLKSEVGRDKTLTELDTLRKVAKSAADSNDRPDARLGSIVIGKIDDYLDNLGADIGGNREAGEAFRSARDLWSRARKAEVLDQALVNAQNQASGFENGIRTQFRQVLKRIDSGKLKGFTNEEREAIKTVVQGTTAGNVARFLGKFGILDGVTSRSLTTIGGAGLAGAAGGAPAAAAVPLIGQVSGALAERMTLNNAKMANALVRAGKNANVITNVYLRNTPFKQRSAQELASLFIKNKVPVETIKVTGARPLLADAAIIAAVAQANENRSDKE